MSHMNWRDLRLPADPAGDTPDLNVGLFEQLQGPRFLYSDEGLPRASEGPLRHTEKTV